ncbi:MAG TPA: hypothetical protein VHA12_04225 [Candidatus Nanoarchaeia archaeon]|nr:hypothetical protein [Candidatus Nanoarchaeia archaeon]
MAKKQIVKDKKDQTAKVIWGILLLIVVFFVSFFAFRGLGTIEYKGLTFTKESIGQNLEVYHYYYLYKDKSGQIVQNNIYLRQNPETNEIPVMGDSITYLPKKFTYVTINASAMEGCKNNAIALSELSAFLVNGGLQVRGAVMVNDTSLTENNATRYVTCKTDKYNSVIQVNYGNESKVDVSGLCSNIQFSTCDDLLPAVEKFIVESIVDAKEASSN